MGNKTVVRVKIVGAYEDAINKALKELDEHYVVSIVPLNRDSVIISYAKKVAKPYKARSEEE